MFGGVAPVRRLLADRYRARGVLLGSGGMGEVYRRPRQLLDRRVAVKVPIDDRHPGLGERFRREARAAARLNHPNIVVGLRLGRGRDRARSS